MRETQDRLMEPAFDYELRRHDDKTTWLAEVLDGQMRTTFEYNFDGYDLYSRDGGSLKAVFKDSLRDAERLAVRRPQLAFELRRRLIESDELDCMLAMARDELPNTMVVISDFPPELMDAMADVGGYNVKRKQTMMRVIRKTRDGRIVMQSQSLDGSDRTALEAIYNSLDFQPQAGELLGQRMHLELDEVDQEFLSDQLMGTYDRSLSNQYGGEWRAGRRPVETLNTYEFVCAQTDLLAAYNYLEESGHTNTGTLYNLAAALQVRLNRYRQVPGAQIEQADLLNLIAEMNGSGERARALGINFSGCGETLTAQEEIKEQGFGNKTNESTEYKFDKKMYCVTCQSPPKEGEAMKMCGPCGICQPCDTAIRRREAAKWN